MIAIVAAMDREVRGIRQEGLGLPGGPTAIMVKVSGTGKDNAVSGIKSLLESPTPPDIVLSVGYAAALKDDLKTGDLVISKQFHINEGTEVLESDSRLVDLTRGILDRSEELRGFIGDSVTVPHVAASKLEKMELVNRTDALIANMEDYWIAAELARRGMPFLSVRAVLDTVDQEIPPFVTRLGDAGIFRQMALVLANTISRPARISQLMHLARQSAEAQQTLVAFFRSLAPMLNEAGSRAIPA